jgi:hypothetical protein
MSADRQPRLPFLDFSGTPYEVGRALGRFGARAMREHIKQTPAWSSVMCRRKDERVTAMAASVEVRFPRYWAELRGLADGLELPFEDVFVWNCRGDVWAMAPDGCTTVQIPGEAAHSIAHNEDGDPGLAGYCALARLAVEGGAAFTAFLYPGSLPGHTFAVTEAGLVQTVNNVRALDGGAGVPRMVLTRALLDASGLDAAITMIRDVAPASGFHLTLAQAGDPRLLSVEFTAKHQSVMEVTAPSVHANHLIHDDIADAPQIVTNSSKARQRRGDLLIAGCQRRHDNLDPLSILWDTEEPALPIYRTDPADPDTENTLASAVFHVGKQRVEWCVYDRPERLARFVIRGGLTPIAA